MNLMLMIAIGILILIMLFLFIVLKRKQKQQMNYRMFFIIGVTWLPLGIATQNYVFSVVGACFLALGLANRKKWKNEPRWAELSPQQRKIKLIMVVFLALLVLAGLEMYLLARNGSLNF